MDQHETTYPVPQAVAGPDHLDAVARLHRLEKAHTRAGDELAAARRRLPAREVDGTLPLAGPDGPVTLLDAFQGRRQLVAYYFMWHRAEHASEVCEGCTFYTSQLRELAHLHSRDTTFAVLCQGPFPESDRYREFMGWEVPWYSALESRDELLAGREIGMFYLVCYVRSGDRVFETYYTSGRGVEAMDNSYGLLDLTVYGRQEPWEDSPAGWPQAWGANGGHPYRLDGRPISQWARLTDGRSDSLVP